MKNLESYLKNKSLIRDRLSYGKAIMFTKLFENSPFNYSYLKKKIPPMGWNWLYFPENYSINDLGKDGHPKRGDFFPKFNGCKRMFAGSEVFFLENVTLDANLTKTIEISNIENKSKSNKKLFFLTLKNTFKKKNKRVLIENQKIVYLDKNHISTKRLSHNLDGYKMLSDINFRFNNVILFKYSALTYNSHRIHYDIEYTRKEEGYKSLLVHGPLLASFLLEFFFSVIRNKDLKSFSFKIIRPVYVNEKITFEIYRNLKDFKNFKIIIINKKLREVKLMANCNLK